MTRKAIPQQRVQVSRTGASYVFHHVRRVRINVAYLLQFRRHHVVALGGLEVCSSEDEDSHSSEEEDASKDGIGLEGEDQVG